MVLTPVLPKVFPMKPYNGGIWIEQFKTVHPSNVGNCEDNDPHSSQYKEQPS